jgi:hypothetical protein
MTFRHKSTDTIPAQRYWTGKPPRQCDACATRTLHEFSDVRMRASGQWAIVCPGCMTQSSEHGARYLREPSGRYRRII